MISFHSETSHWRELLFPTATMLPSARSPKVCRSPAAILPLDRRADSRFSGPGLALSGRSAVCDSLPASVSVGTFSTILSVLWTAAMVSLMARSIRFAASQARNNSAVFINAWKFDEKAASLCLQRACPAWNISARVGYRSAQRLRSKPQGGRGSPEACFRRSNSAWFFLLCSS